jgi:hypothetical protein
MRNFQLGLGKNLALQAMWLCIAFEFLFISCKQNDASQLDQLYGKWEISKAERNGKETNYLRRGYFLIRHDGTMVTNITGADEKGTYVIEKNKLKMGTMNFEFQLVKPDSMIMQYLTSPGNQFVFYMQKKEENDQ